MSALSEIQDTLNAHLYAMRDTAEFLRAVADDVRIPEGGRSRADYLRKRLDDLCFRIGELNHHDSHFFAIKSQS